MVGGGAKDTRAKQRLATGIHERQQQGLGRDWEAERSSTKDRAVHSNDRQAEQSKTGQCGSVVQLQLSTWRAGAATCASAEQREQQIFGIEQAPREHVAA